MFDYPTLSEILIFLQTISHSDATIAPPAPLPATTVPDQQSAARARLANIVEREVRAIIGTEEALDPAAPLMATGEIPASCYGAIMQSSPMLCSKWGTVDVLPCCAASSGIRRCRRLPHLVLVQA